MTTLHESTLFNNIKLINNGGEFTGEAGMVLVNELMTEIGFDSLLRKNIHINDQRHSPKYEYLTILKQVILQIIAGYKHDVAANQLQYDPLFNLLLEQDKAASQPTISRFISQFTTENIQELETVIRKLATKLFEYHNQQQFIIDVDSTHADTYGHQEKANYNAHYQTNGYHPLVAFDSSSGQLLGVKLRPGNRYTSTGVSTFLQSILNEYRSYSCDPDILIRGDSGFATPELYDLCDEQNCHFIVKAKANHRLQYLAEEHDVYGGSNNGVAETYYYELAYRPGTWKQQYRVVLKSTKAPDELLFNHTFLITNLSELSSDKLFKIYDKRGNAENYIKEAKLGFFLDKTDSHSYLTNAIHMLISAIAYNVVQILKQLALPAGEANNGVMALRFKLFHVPAKIIHHARKTIVQLSKANVFDRLFWQVLHRIQALQLTNI